MIIGVSIVDRHKPHPDNHVGTYFFEIDYPRDTHFDFLVLSSENDEGEEKLRPYLNRLLSAAEIPDAIRGDGTPV